MGFFGTIFELITDIIEVHNSGDLPSEHPIPDICKPKTQLPENIEIGISPLDEHQFYGVSKESYDK